MKPAEAPRLYLLILALQTVLMLTVAVGPFFDGSFQFSLIPFEWHKTFGFLLNLSGFLTVTAAVAAMRGSFTIFVKPREEGKLIQSGAFKLCRNPIYFGGLLMCFGWSISFQSMLSLICSALLVPVLLWKVSYEEIELLALYGEEYTRYKSATKRLIPFVI
ncbi:MAG: hypothetical protein K0R29_2475 [Pseudobdellovibrio sp.]|jgi:protein-S-isoprenylcysteine O-methyltransferase Ste14|nr:hypothetical protein [Pseudobdellovibrio sp.]